MADTLALDAGVLDGDLDGTDLAADLGDLATDPDAGPGVAFLLAGSSEHVGANCADSSKQHDLIVAPFALPGPEVSVTRNSGSAVWCSQPFEVGTTLSAGTTLVRLYASKTQGTGSTCRVTLKLLKNGTKLLGTGSFVLCCDDPLARRAIVFSSEGATFEVGDQLNLQLTWEPVKSCNDVRVRFADPDVPSSLHLPPMN
ncbi:MAG: hypothetical protein JRH20_12465 [Deltaproteobacteria bacterium]|nr:hypothetical protein [Deltaproteobacteria bacterium]